MNNLVEVKIENKNGELYVSSRDIANGLGKRHTDVMNQIKKIYNEQNENVRYAIIPNKYNDRGRELNEYLLTKDGFTLYMFNIQGYNEFKMAYINKFNEMEKALKNNMPQLTEAEKIMISIFRNDIMDNDKLSLSIANNNELVKVRNLARLGQAIKEEVSKPLLETIDNQKEEINNQEIVNDMLLPSGNLYGVRYVGRVLKGYTDNMGGQKVFEYLRNNKILIAKKGAQEHNTPYSQYAKYFRMKPARKYGMCFFKPFFTKQGLNWFLKRLAKDGILNRTDIEKVENEIIDNNKKSVDKLN